MTLLFLIRHGLTDQTGKRLYGRTPGIDLSLRGREQAEALVERFQGIELAAVYSSPLERCTQTAQPLATARKLKVREREGLIEMDAGAWTGRPLGSLARTKLWKVIQQEPSRATFPGGEDFVGAQDRAVEEVGKISKAHPRGGVAVFSHGDIIRLLVSHFAGAPIDEFQRVVVDTTSVSVFALQTSGPPRLLLVNDMGGLGAFARTPPAKRSRPGVRG